MAGITPSSSVNLGKKPDWRLTSEQLLRLPSVVNGIDINQELKMRQQAAQFIQDMADKLNQNVQQRGKINQLCICVSMVHMHRFFVVHSFRMFDPRDVAAACLFLAGKSEECPRKLEHIVDVWFKLKNRKAEVQPPFNETVRREGAELIVYLESVLLQTIGFDLQVELPHPLVIKYMNDFAMDNQAMARSAYWFASEMIRLTTFPVRYSIKTIACLSIFLVALWSEFEIPDRGGTPWFKCIEPEMTVELLNKLADEFTRIYEKCGSAECRKAVESLERLRQSTTSAVSSSFMAQLPPPPPPPNLQLTKDAKQREQPDKREQTSSAAPRQLKRSPPSMGVEEGSIPIKRPCLNEQMSTSVKNNKVAPGEKLPHIPQLKLEPVPPTINNNSPSNHANERKKDDDTAGMATSSLVERKKIGVKEYMKRLKSTNA